jgi:hypothetical protein
MSRQRWRPTPAIPPRGNVTLERAPAVAGAVCHPDLLRSQDDPSLGRYPAPEPFDWSNIVAVPAGASTTIIIGQPGASGVGALSRQVTPGRRGVVLGLATYLEANSGQVMGPGRIPNLGAGSLQWAILVNGRPFDDYGAVNTVQNLWNDPLSSIPLLEAHPGDMLSVVITCNNVTGAYAFFGARLRGQMLPWSTDGTVFADQAERSTRGTPRRPGTALRAPYRGRR